MRRALAFPTMMLIVFSLATSPPGAAETRSATAPVEIVVFWAPGCPHCANARDWLAGNAGEGIAIRAIDVSASAADAALFAASLRFFGVARPAVPLVVVGRRHFVGFGGARTGERILAAAEACRAGGCPTLGELLGGRAEAAPGEPAAGHGGGAAGVGRGPPARIVLPLFGPVDAAALSLPALTVLLAAVDGFNPCAMWVLVFLIGLLLGMEDRARMWLLGGVFLAVSGLVYFAFLAAWLNVFLVVGALSAVRVAVGLFALGSGALYLRDFATDRAAECRVTDPARRRRILDALKATAAEPRFLAAVVGIAAVAVAVNLVELVCSAGLPAIFTEVLALADLSTWERYGYIGLYVVVFMVDDVAIFVLAMTTLAVTGLTGRYLRVSHLLGGLVMTAIGLMLIFEPGLLAFAT